MYLLTNICSFASLASMYFRINLYDFTSNIFVNINNFMQKLLISVYFHRHLKEFYQKLKLHLRKFILFLFLF